MVVLAKSLIGSRQRHPLTSRRFFDEESADNDMVETWPIINL